MKLIIVSSSQRSQSESEKVAIYLAKNSEQFTDIEHIDLYQQALPMWDGCDESKFNPQSNWARLSKQLTDADALVVVTPEWGGTASPLLKNFLMMCEIHETGHKPVLIVSVVNGVSGAYPIAELRMNAFSNNKLVAIPDHLIIRNVEEVLNDARFENNNVKLDLSTRDKRLRHRIAYSIHTLFHYASALKNLRKNLSEQPFNNEELYTYGM
ncbi:NAD(P)H-dependent oxidoreductase [Colwellia asteriadis]|uniref:NAD(P)H-dependent oxidoreductase n=1 Tax=Colwellia asteriadis TaxID=517723 RepID=A0ABN1L417_9GAMM